MPELLFIIIETDLLKNIKFMKGEEAMELPFLIDLTGQVAVVTGGSGIIGGMFARALAKCGAKIAVLGRKAENGIPVVKDIEAEGGEAISVAANVLDKESLEEARREILDKWGKINILVSTTVIEVGVNVPNATLMIVENAERFGLSQLHQLRGRVGRGKKKSYCVLVSGSAGKEGTAGERLKIMRTTYNGYEIAEKDLEMRGPGDFVKGTSGSHVRQSGGVRFRLAELCDDTGLLKKAFADASDILSKSPELDSYPKLKKAVDDMFSLDQAQIS